MACGAVTVGQAMETPEGITIKTSRPNIDNLSNIVSVVWQDNRLISADQRRKAHALVGEICEWAGYYGQAEHENMNTDLKHRFLLTYSDVLVKDMFSLADCDMTTARRYIDYLIDFVLRNDVPVRVPLVTLCDDIERYVYACLMNKKCAVCGAKCDLHHVDRVGMGRDRKEIVHEGMKVMPLCRKHHDECHMMGQSRFDELYHLEGIPADKKICKKYGLKAEVE